MSGHGGKRSRRDGGLEPDDQALWEHVVEHVEPLDAKPRVTDIAAEPPDGSNSGVTAGSFQTRRPGRIAPKTPAPQVADSAGPPAKRRWQPLVTGLPAAPSPAPSPSVGFDRRKARRLAAGHTEIEARLDLHGLREGDAHTRLVGFLRQSHARGLRTVLVITGKGRSDDDPTTPFELGQDRRARGVIKRNVPRWLAEPALAPLVVSYAAAHPRHGGEGALYVHLRRARS